MHEDLKGFGAKMALRGETLVRCPNPGISLWLTSSLGRDILYELATAGELPLPNSPMSTNKRDRDSDTPRSTASGESPQPVTQDDGPRVIAGSRRINKDLSTSGQSKRVGQSQHQSNQQLSSTPSTSTSHIRQSTHDLTDHSMTSSVPATSTYALPVYSDELGRLPLHGHLNFSSQAYVDQTNYWYHGDPNRATGGGSSESSSNPDHIVPSNSLSHLSSCRQHQHQQVPDHHHVQSSHNVNNYSDSTTETSTITQGFSFNSSIRPGNIVFDSVPTYIPPTAYAGVSSSIDIAPPLNPVVGGGRPSPASFRGISMALRGDRGGVLDRRQESSHPTPHLEQPQHQHHQHYTQGQREHDVYGNHHHREQQQPMGYSTFLDNDTMAMWSTAPAGFECVLLLLCRG